MFRFMAVFLLVAISSASSMSSDRRSFMRNSSDAAEPTISKSQTKKLLDRAARNQIELAMKALRKGADPNARYSNGCPVLFQAISLNSIKLVEAILVMNDSEVDIADRANNRALFWALNAQSLPMVKTLLAHGADPYLPSPQGLPPLHTAVKLNNIAIVQELLDNKADVNQVTSDGTHPLHIAAQSGFLLIATVLLDNNAQIDPIGTPQSLTPSSHAALAGKWDVAKLLIERGANPAHFSTATLENQLKSTNLLDKKYLFEIVELLKKRGQVISKELLSAAIIPAIQTGNLEVVTTLLSGAGDLVNQAYEGSTPLYLAAYYGQPKIAEWLLDQDASINIGCEQQNLTPVWGACQQLKWDVALLLIRRGAEIDTEAAVINGKPVSARTMIFEPIKKISQDLIDAYRFITAAEEPNPVAAPVARNNVQISDIFSLDN